MKCQSDEWLQSLCVARGRANIRPTGTANTWHDTYDNCQSDHSVEDETAEGSNVFIYFSEHGSVHHGHKALMKGSHIIQNLLHYYKEKQSTVFV